MNSPRWSSILHVSFRVAVMGFIGAALGMSLEGAIALPLLYSIWWSVAAIADKEDR